MDTHRPHNIIPEYEIPARFMPLTDDEAAMLATMTSEQRHEWLKAKLPTKEVSDSTGLGLDIFDRARVYELRLRSKRGGALADAEREWLAEAYLRDPVAYKTAGDEVHGQIMAEFRGEGEKR